MNIEQIINDIGKDTYIHFHAFEQYNDVIVAKSHFLNFHFGTDRVEIVLDYPVPGPRMTQFSVERLPIFLDYNTENFYTTLVDIVNDIEQKLIALEYRDEEEE